ncbi:MAG TPA: hypothetical protein VH186_03950 [Chloroflexia bacterium]|nr:hypothetical protein [Chloroflexia bacterium]
MAADNNKDNFEKEVAISLAPLIAELKELDEWPCLDLDGVLLLYDLCNRLNLSIATTCNVLGTEATRYLLELGVLERKNLPQTTRLVLHP